MARGGPGKPTRCTPEAIATACEHAGLGRPDWACAIAAGVEPDTLKEWKQKGAKGQEPYATFRAKFELARRERTKFRLMKIETASKDDWKAAAWLLERQEPREFAKSRIGPIELPENATTADMFTALARRAIESGDFEIAMSAAKEAAHLRGEYPSDKAAVSRAGLDDKTAKIVGDRGAVLLAAFDAIRDGGGARAVVGAAPDDRNLDDA